MYILVLDTATKRLSVALMEISSKRIIASYMEREDENSHARKINVAILDLLKEANIEMNQLSAVAVNEGPGSFTGLRVGSSSAKGLCFALDIPLIAICGLAAYGKYLFELESENVTDVFVLLDARRGNYFYSHINQNKQESQAYFKHIIDIEAEISSSSKPWIIYLEKENKIELNARILTNEVLEKWNAKEFADIRHFEPQYIVNNYLSKNDI